MNANNWKIFLAVLSALVLIPMTGFAQEAAGDQTVNSQASPSGGYKIASAGNIGVGIRGGRFDTTGVTGKYYLGNGSAVQLTVGIPSGYSYGSTFGGFGAAADFVYDFTFSANEFGNVFAGVGGGVGFSSVSTPLNSSATVFDIHAILEVGYHLNIVPVEFALDYRPGVGFGSSSGSATFEAGGSSVTVSGGSTVGGFRGGAFGGSIRYFF